MFPGILLSVVTTQVTLWTSYMFFFNQKGVDFSSMWGRTPPWMHSYLLVSAGVAYAMNLFLLSRLATTYNLNEADKYTVVACVWAYYIAQLFFLPLTHLALRKEVPKAVVTVLLVLCVVPFVFLTGVVTRHTNNPLDLTFAYIPLLHVVINDAILFGFLF
jgi:hypothetical protein